MCFLTWWQHQQSDPIDRIKRTIKRRHNYLQRQSRLDRLQAGLHSFVELPFLVWVLSLSLWFTIHMELSTAKRSFNILPYVSHDLKLPCFMEFTVSFYELSPVNLWNFAWYIVIMCIILTNNFDWHSRGRSHVQFLDSFVGFCKICQSTSTWTVSFGLYPSKYWTVGLTGKRQSWPSTDDHDQSTTAPFDSSAGRSTDAARTDSSIVATSDATVPGHDTFCYGIK